MESNAGDVSDPLKHLFSLDFSRTSPLLNEVSLNADVSLNRNSPKSKKKVRFAEPFAFDERSTLYDNASTVSEIRGILKKKLSLEESEYALSNLRIEDSGNDDYSEISSFEDDSSVDEEDVTPSENGFEDSPTDVTDDVQIEEVHDPETNDLKLAVNREIQPRPPADFKYNVRMKTDNAPDTTSDLPKQNIATFIKSDNIQDLPLTESSLNQDVNPPILNIFSDAKSEDGNVTMKHKCLKSVCCISKKPKLHFCAIPLFKQDNDSSKIQEESHGGCFQRSKISNSKMVHPYGNYLKQCHVKKNRDFDDSFLMSQQTLKLQSLLKENTTSDIFSAKELKSAVFSAWHQVKNEEKLDKNASSSNFSGEFNEKQKIIKSSVSARGYLYWKKRKEHYLKKKKQHLLKPKPNLSTQVLSEEEKRKKEEERALVYKSWKQKKDEQLKLKLQKEHKRARINKFNSLKDDEIRKKDAASAFLAWKSIKLNSEVKKQEQINFVQRKTNRQKLDERSERDKEAQEAYDIWLQQKGKLKPGDSWNISDRPPWNPPG